MITFTATEQAQIDDMVERILRGEIDRDCFVQTTDHLAAQYRSDPTPTRHQELMARQIVEVRTKPATPVAESTSFPCQHCKTLIATEGKDIHLCTTRIKIGRKAYTSREYVGYYDSQLISGKPTHHEVEVALDRYAMELIESGLTATVTELDGSDPEHVEMVEPALSTNDPSLRGPIATILPLPSDPYAGNCMYLKDLWTLRRDGAKQVEMTTIESFDRLVTTQNVIAVMFHFWDYPRRAVHDKAKARKLVTKLLRQYQGGSWGRFRGPQIPASSDPTPGDDCPPSCPDECPDHGHGEPQADVIGSTSGYVYVDTGGLIAARKARQNPPATMDEAVERAWAMRHVPLVDEERYMHSDPPPPEDEPTEDDILDKIFLPSELDEGADPGDVPNPDEPTPENQGDSPPTGWGETTRIAGFMTGECPDCGTIQRLSFDGISWACDDSAACNGRMVASVKVLHGYCGACYGPHCTWHCPEIGAILMRDRSIFEELPMLRSAHRTAIADGYYVVANGLVDRGACLTECYVSCVDGPVVVEA